MFQGIDPIFLTVPVLFLLLEQPLQISPILAGDLFDALAFVFAEADGGEELGLGRDVEHFFDRPLFGAELLGELREEVLEERFEDEDVADRVVRAPLYLDAERVAQVLEAVVREALIRIERGGDLVGADDVGRLDALAAQDGDVEGGVVGDADDVFVLECGFDVRVSGRIPECGFVRHHFLGDVVDRHRFVRDRQRRLVHFVDERLCDAALLDAELHEPVAVGVAGGFGVEKEGPHALSMPRFSEIGKPWPS